MTVGSHGRLGWVGFLLFWVGTAGCGGAGSELPTASIPGPSVAGSTESIQAGVTNGLQETEGEGETALDSPTSAAVTGSGGSFVPPAERMLGASPGESAFPTTSPTAGPAASDVNANPPEVLIRTSLGDIRVELDAARAPETVDNFLTNYVDRKFYSETVFHFVEPAFIILGGSYTAQLEPKETRTPIHNEARNGLKNRRGTIAMSRHPSYVDSATAEFFINIKDNPTLDHQSPEDAAKYGYCVFGEVVEGMEVVDKIAQVAVGTRGDFTQVPVEPVVIHSVERLK
jgi:peptidyl-prolyl cis-trans isomerase A (cyclophilin A)